MFWNEDRTVLEIIRQHTVAMAVSEHDRYLGLMRKLEEVTSGLDKLMQSHAALEKHVSTQHKDSLLWMAGRLETLEKLVKADINGLADDRAEIMALQKQFDDLAVALARPNDPEGSADGNGLEDSSPLAARKPAKTLERQKAGKRKR